MTAVPPPSAVLFDWDNTLVDGWVAIAAALNAVFQHHAMPHWSPAEAQANVRGSMRDSFPAMFGAGWEQDAALFYATLRETHLAHLHPMRGAARLIQVAAARAPCAVVSNKSGTLLRREVGHLGWGMSFGAVIGAGDAAADKPDAAPLLLALRQLGALAAPSVWFIGDTALDMCAARAAGCRAVLIGEAAHDGGRAAAAPDAWFRDADQLADELQCLER